MLERVGPDGKIASVGGERLLELGVDVETRSTIDLRKVGVHRYATHPSTTMLCAVLTTADAPPELWTPDKPCPEIVKRAVAGWIIHAFHANFERTIWRQTSNPGSRQPCRGVRICRCSMAMAQLERARNVFQFPR
jgi:DNA polymerase bacteriophage-type